MPIRAEAFDGPITTEKSGFLQTLFYAAVSALCTVTAVFIAGGSVYHIFFEQYTSFILERMTGFHLLGRMISRYDYGSVFYTGFIFWIKFIIFFMFIFSTGFTVLSKRLFRLGEILCLSTAAAASYGPVLVFISVIIKMAGLIVPAYLSWFFYLSCGGIFIILLPVTLQKLIDSLDEKISPFRLYFSYYLAAFLILLLWTYNHYNFSLLRML